MPKLTANVDRAWFEERIRNLGISQAEFGRRMGLDRSALSRTLSGERGTKASEVRRMAEVLGRPEHEVLKHLAGETKHVFASGGTARIVEARSGFSEGQTNFKGYGDMTEDNEEYIVAPQGDDPLFGCMAGTLTLLPDVDYTAPADPDWGKVYED